MVVRPLPPPLSWGAGYCATCRGDSDPVDATAASLGGVKMPSVRGPPRTPEQVKRPELSCTTCLRSGPSSLDRQGLKSNLEK
jgi:hypothetical protein